MLVQCTMCIGGPFLAPRLSPTMGFFSDLARRHEELKNKIHSTRIPLSPRGVAIMKVVYVASPVVAGMLFMEGVKRWYVVAARPLPRMRWLICLIAFLEQA